MALRDIENLYLSTNNTTTTTTDIASSLNLFTDLEPGVDGDAAAVVLLDAELLEAQISGVGTSANAHQQHVRVELKKEQD